VNTRRSFSAVLFVGMFVCLAIAGLRESNAQAWPTKQPVRVIVPLSPGSAIDIVARVVFEQVSKQLGQTFVVENRAGASQTIGAGAVAKSDPDGYTILVASSTLTVVPSTMANLTFDVGKDLAAVAALASVPTVMVVSPAKGHNTVHDFVKAAKAKPGSVTYGSAGRGDSTHLAAERFRLSAGFEGVYVPFKGAPEVLTEVMAGRLDFYFSPAAPALPLIRDGKLKPLATASSKRGSAIPDVPTTTEAGFANSDYEFWIGAFVTAATPRPLVDRLHQEITKAIESAAVRERLKSIGGDPMPMSPTQFGDLIKKEIGVNASVVKAAGIQTN
jgi:tripartite-type tricarboxylate transporter receptor subunit TctC